MGKLLIIAVIAAALIIGGAVIYARQAPAPSSANAPEFGFSGEKLLIEAVYQSCSAGDRCIVVDAHCGFCCDYSVINARYEDAFNTAFDQSCRKYNGTYCSCFDLSSYPSCVEGTCRLVSWPQDSKSSPAPVSPPAIQQQPIAQHKETAPSPAPVQAPAPGKEPLPESETAPVTDEELFAPLPSEYPADLTGGDGFGNNDGFGGGASDPVNKPLPQGNIAP